MSYLSEWLNPMAYIRSLSGEKDPQMSVLEVRSTHIQSGSEESRECVAGTIYDDEDPTINGCVQEDCPTVIHLIIKNARKTPHKLSLVWLDGDLRETEKYTYKELEERVHAVAHMVTIGHGLSRGDRALLVFLPDASGAFITSFLGCLLAGVIPVPIYPPSPATLAQDLERMSKIVDAAGPKIALTTSKFKRLMIAARMKMALSHGFQYSWPSSLPWPAVDNVTSLPAGAKCVDEYLKEIHPGEIAFLQFTSGSTGFPKGVVVSHSNLNHNIACQIKLLASKSKPCDLVMVGWLPLYHDFGLISGAVFGSASGGLLVGQSPLTFLRKPLSWLEAISKYRGTHTGAPNFALARCVKTWKNLAPRSRPKLDLPSLEGLSIGAEPIQSSVLKDFAIIFQEHGLGKDTLQPCYGLAEHVVFLTSSARTKLEDQVSEDGFVISGVVQYGIDVRIINHHTLKECAPGMDGEIWVSSPSVCQGYWNMPELSKEVFKVPFGDRNYLRTGDLGRVVRGILYVTGRLKDVIIVGGENHYPQDIEQTVLSTHPLVRPGRVAAFTLGDDRIGLVVELNIEKPEPSLCDEIFQRIIREVRNAHKLTVSRIKLIKPRSIPRTTSGKIQRQESRRSLLEGKLRGIPSGEFDAGSTFGKSSFAQSNASSSLFDLELNGLAQEEAQILGTICNVCVLSPAEVDMDRSLSDNGVTSMQAFAIVGSLESIYPGLDLLMLMRPTPVRKLVKDIVGTSQSNKIREIKSVPIQDVMFGVPLSYGQEQMAIIQQLMPDSSAYNVPVTIKLTGRLNVNSLQKALEEIIERHWILSMKLENRSGELVQVLDGALRQALHTLKVVDIRHVHKGDKDTCQSIVDNMLLDAISQPFDLFKGPVTRVILIRASNLEHILLVMCHHAIVDGWSMRILASDLCHLYNACASGKAVPMARTQIKFHDYAEWQRKMLHGSRLDELLAFWKENLKGAPRLLELPTDKPRKQFLTTAPAGHVPFYIGHSNLLKLRAISANYRVTLFTTLLSIFNVLLSRYSRQTDVVVGTPFAGRTQAQFMKVVGYIANSIALRTDLSGNPTFCDLLQRCREVCLNAFEHSAAPISKVVGAVGAGDDVSYAPIFQVMFNLQQMNLMDQEMEMVGCKVETLTLYSRPQESRFDLSLELMEEQSSVNGFLEYSTDLFEYTTAQRIANHFSNLIDSVVEAPEYCIGKLRMLSIFESRDLERRAKEIRHEYKIMNTTLQELIHAQATRNPSTPCLLFCDQQITFGDIEIASNQLANYLITLGVGPNRNVGVMTEKSIEMIIAILGILKAGGAYTPIDPLYPSCRIASIAEDADLRIVIIHSSDEAAERIVSLGLYTIHLSGKHKSAELAQHPVSYPENRSGPSNVAYTIFTSGTTGRPKGVMITHRSVVNFLQWMMREFKLTSRDRYLQNINFTFDLSMMEIFLPLTSSALLILPDPKLHPDPTYVAGLINSSAATFCCSVPSVLRGFVDSCQAGDCRTMRTQICCGEVLPTSLAARFIEKLPFCTLANTYGPTEATIHVTSHIVTPDSLIGPLSIGRPICNVSVYIVDHYLNPCSVGVSGELMISGACLAKGYAKQKELTSEKFIRNPFCALSDLEDYQYMYKTGDLACWNADGTIRILGRTDNQVKVRGFRIELEEVEKGLSNMECVDQAVASVRSDPSGDHHLIAYIVPESADPGSIKSELGERLPHYMVPSVVIPMRSFSLLPNGKIDREALPEPVWGTEDIEEFVTPRNEIENKILNVWKEVLGVEDISIHSDFFKIGGDSLKAGLVASRIQDLLGVKVPGILVFRYRTVGGLAKYSIENVQDENSNCMNKLNLLPLSVADFGPEQLMGGVPISFSQRRILSLYECDKQGSAYNVPMATRLEGHLDPIALKKSVYYLTSRHRVLAMRFRKVGDNQWLHAKCDEDTALNMNILDLTYMSACFESDITARAMEILHEDASKPFMLYKEAPIRITLLRIGEKDHLLMLCMHHVACDGISIGIIASEFVECYNTLGKDHAPKLTRRPLQFYDYSMWQVTSMESGCFAPQLNFWKEQLKNLPIKPLLPVDPDLLTPQPGRQDSFGKAGYIDIVAPAALVAGLKSIGCDHGATLFMVLLSAFNLLLNWVSGCTDIVVGVPHASGRLHKETENMLGCFVNPLPIRVDVGKFKTFLDLLVAVRDVMLLSFENGEAPLDKIIEELGLEYSAAVHPIYQVVLVLQETEAYRPVLKFHELEATPILHASHVRHSSQFVTIDLVETSAGLNGSMWYNADLFSEDQASYWVMCLADILKAISSDPHASLESLRAMLWSDSFDQSISTCTQECSQQS